MNRHPHAIATACSAVFLTAFTACAGGALRAPAASPPGAPIAISSANASAGAEAAASDVVGTTTTTGAELPLPPAPPDLTAEEAAADDGVLRALHPDVLACYRARLRASPEAQGVITLDVVVAPDGSVSSVAASEGTFLGGAPLGARTTACVVQRVERATFAPVHGGGTRHLHAPMVLRKLGPDGTAM